MEEKLSVRDIFVDEYVNYILKMNHISKINKFNGHFYELILFIHKETISPDCHLQNYKLKNNCFFINNVFDETTHLQDHGLEYQMFTKYVTEFCPSEISINLDKPDDCKPYVYGCNFDCSSTFNLITKKLKKVAHSKEEIMLAHHNLELLKKSDNLEEYKIKEKEYKQLLITTKNICAFIKNTISK